MNSRNEGSSELPRVLLQFDSDQHPSSFDAIVALDAGVDQLLPYGNVEQLDVRDLVHGAMFTRGSDSLRRTAIFIGGSNVQSGEHLLSSVLNSFFGPVRVSVMMDANGSNTTASAAVLAVERHTSLAEKTVTILGATGPVGQRVAHLVAQAGGTAKLVSRSLERAQRLAERLAKKSPEGNFQTLATDGQTPVDWIDEALDADAVVAAGAAGVELVPEGKIASSPSQPNVIVDLNAVPPSGIGDINPTDAGRMIGETAVWGAIGVGNLKMKIHRRCIELLFESNDRVLDIDEIYGIGSQLLNKA